MKGNFLLIVFFFNLYFLQAQIPELKNIHAQITGKVIDSTSGQPLEYATITLFLTGIKKPVNGNTSNTSGKFIVKDIAAGTYKIVVEFIGYYPYTFNNIEINKQNLSVDLKTVLLAKNPGLLHSVTVSKNGDVIENRIDKIIFNAEKDLTSQGGVATDILKKIPQVSVDADGKVELAGNTSIRFLIDGKPSSAFGSNITDVLQSIPASQVQSIEVVTNPGAKYDAQGLGGIINIILKKNTAKGINGNISLTGGTRIENGSFNFNARNKNFGINAFISGNERLTINTIFSTDMLSANADTNNLLHQEGNTRLNRYGYESGIGFDWTYNKKNVFSGSVNYNHFGNSTNGLTSQSQVTTLNGSNIKEVTNTNKIGSSFRFHNIDAGLDYKRIFDKEAREFEISVNSSFGNNNEKADNHQFLLPQDSLIYATNNLSRGSDNEIEFKIDYTEPISKKVLLGAGGKLSLYDVNNISDVSNFEDMTMKLRRDTSLSNSLQYHQKVYAVYSELSFSAGKLFDAKIGGRYERTEINSFYSNARNQLSTPGYNTFVPSVYFLKKIDDRQTLKLSYSKRINRPQYEDLNPFINTSDPKNISTGNPYLKPEISNNYELGYSLELGSAGSLMITAFYRTNHNDVQYYIVYYSSVAVGDSIYKDVAVGAPQNIGNEKNIGINLFANINFTSKFNVRTNSFIFQSHTINTLDAGYNSNSLNYRFTMNANYQFNKDLAAEFFGNFRSARHEAQGSYPSFTTYSMALRKLIWNKKGSLAFTAINPFKEYIVQKTMLFGPKFTVNGIRKIPFRSFGINFTWKFGQLEFKKDREDHSINLNALTE